MKKKILFGFLFLFVSFLTFIKVDAATCSVQEMNELKQLATNIKFNYELYSEEGYRDNYFFNVYAVNFLDKFFIIFSEGDMYTYSKDLDINGARYLDVFSAGNDLKFYIYASAETNCANRQVAVKEVSLPYFNSYSLREECKGIEEFSLCQRYYNGNIKSEEYFLEQVQKYKKNGNSSNGNKNILDYIVDFISNNLILTL